MGGHKIDRSNVLELAAITDGFEVFSSEDREDRCTYWNTSIPLDILLHIGGLDERFANGFSWEDEDFCNRLLKIYKYPWRRSSSIIGLHLPHPFPITYPKQAPSNEWMTGANACSEVVVNKEMEWGVNDGEILYQNGFSAQFVVFRERQNA